MWLYPALTLKKYVAGGDAWPRSSEPQHAMYWSVWTAQAWKLPALTSAGPRAVCALRRQNFVTCWQGLAHFRLYHRKYPSFILQLFLNLQTLSAELSNFDNGLQIFVNVATSC